MKKNIIISIKAIVLSTVLFFTASAQDIKEVEVKGQGLKRDDAIQNALRNAVSEAIGVSLVSETKVENFMVIQDAIQTRTQGYISSYEIIKEVPFPDRYEVTTKAKVSLSPIKADINYLAQSLGGIRFLVMYDDRNVKEEERAYYESAVERINQFLSERKYRYIEKTRFNALKKESVYIMKEQGDLNEESYVQKLGMMADAQFIIFIKKIGVQTKSEAFDTRTSSMVSIETKAYDNCTAEGLGTIVMDSEWKNARDEASTITAGVTESINKNFEKLLGVFNSYMGEWVNNGTPYELRFYSSGTYRDLRDLRQKIKEDNSFGGQLEVVGLTNYSKMNCTFRKKPDDLADKVLDIADAIPGLKEKRMDVKFIYGRQISFAPQNVKLPDMPAPATQEVKQPSQTKPTSAPAQKKATPAKSTGTKTPAKTTTKTTPTKK